MAFGSDFGNSGKVPRSNGVRENGVRENAMVHRTKRTVTVMVPASLSAILRSKGYQVSSIKYQEFGSTCGCLYRGRESGTGWAGGKETGSGQDGTQSTCSVEIKD